MNIKTDPASFSKHVKALSYESNKKASNIPDEYFTYSLGDYNFKNKDGSVNGKKLNALKLIMNYCDNLEERYKKGRGLFIHGPSNQQCGITLLGTFVLRQALNKNFKCLFTEFSSFALNLSYFESSAQVNNYYNTDFLMIDCINPYKSLNTSKVRDTFSDIVSYRRNNKKPIIFSSYKTPYVLVDLYSDMLGNYFDSYIDEIDLTFPIKGLTLEEAKQKIKKHQDRNPQDLTRVYPFEELLFLLKDGTYNV